LKIFLNAYRSHIRSEYPAYFNEFPFYGALRAIGVISRDRVYVLFTKDGNPTTTKIDVFDENDMPDLMRVKDAKNPKWEEIFALLNIESYIPDIERFLEVGESLSRTSYDEYWKEDHAANVALRSVQFHYDYVEKQKDPTVVLKGAEKPSIIMPNYTFVYNTIDERSLRAKVEDIIDKTEEGEEVLITGWIGSFAMPLLNFLTKKNVRFRIITHRPTAPERGKLPSDEYDVFTKTLVRKYPDNVRILGKLHARLLISEKEALVSTADLTKDSQEGKIEAGICTTDGLTIIKLKGFFEMLWELATLLRK